MSTYGREDYEDLRYELDKFLEDHYIYELLELVTDAVRLYELENRKNEQQQNCGYRLYWSASNSVHCLKTM